MLVFHLSKSRNVLCLKIHCSICRIVLCYVNRNGGGGGGLDKSKLKSVKVPRSA